ncbi:adenylate kinase [bacterium]|nr:adenylate kinase [bacterium]
MILILLGAPGAGKGTQAEKIKVEYNLLHLSTGDLLRAAVADGTELGKLAKDYMNAGKLVPDDVILGIIRDFMKENTGKGVLFDGFPRTVMQAGGLDEILRDEKVRALSLEVDDEQVIKRLSARRVCRECGKVYNPALGINPPKENACECGGEIYQRDDDHAETIANRLKVYHDQTEPVIEYYRGKSQLLIVNGTGTPDEVFGRIREALV